MTTTRTRRALVVDDVPSNRKLAPVFLAKLGWDAVEVDEVAGLDRELAGGREFIVARVPRERR